MKCYLFPGEIISDLYIDKIPQIYSFHRETRTKLYEVSLKFGLIPSFMG